MNLQRNSYAAQNAITPSENTANLSFHQIPLLSSFTYSGMNLNNNSRFF